MKLTSLHPSGYNPCLSTSRVPFFFEMRLSAFFFLLVCLRFLCILSKDTKRKESIHLQDAPHRCRILKNPQQFVTVL